MSKITLELYSEIFDESDNCAEVDIYFNDTLLETELTLTTESRVLEYEVAILDGKNTLRIDLLNPTHMGYYDEELAKPVGRYAVLTNFSYSTASGRVEIVPQSGKSFTDPATGNFIVLETDPVDGTVEYVPFAFQVDNVLVRGFRSMLVFDTADNLIDSVNGESKRVEVNVEKGYFVTPMGIWDFASNKLDSIPA